MKQLAILGVALVLGGCSSEQLLLADRLMGVSSQGLNQVGDTLYEGTRDMNKHPVPVPAVTFDGTQPASQPDVRTVWIDAGNGRQRYFCSGAGANTRCWQ